MNVIILGAGRRGIRLAKQLIDEKKSVIFIDSDNSRCSQVMSRLDCMAVCGSATDLSSFEEAGAREADAIIALTNSDEVNLVACGIASSNFPSAVTVAAIRAITYLGKERGAKILGIDHIVNPEEEAAKRLAAIIKTGIYSDIMSFDDADFILFNSRISPDSPMKGRTLMDIRKNLDKVFVAIGIRRKGKVFTPNGFTVLEEGDDVALIAKDTDTREVFSAFSSYKSSTRVKKILVVGATRITRYLFHSMGERLLSRTTLMEREKKLCQEFADEFPSVLVINESVTDESVWDDEGLWHSDLLVSVTDDDELNIITASYAKRMGVKKAMALLKTNPNYRQLASALDIDAAISTTDATADSIMKHIRGKSVKTLHSTFDGELEVYEYIIGANNTLCGKKLMEANLKGRCMIAGIRRKGMAAFVPDGSYVFQEGDTVLAACIHDNYDFVTGLFK